jgi:hypothetical protein
MSQAESFVLNKSCETHKQHRKKSCETHKQHLFVTVDSSPTAKQPINAQYKLDQSVFGFIISQPWEKLIDYGQLFHNNCAVLVIISTSQGC